VRMRAPAISGVAVILAVVLVATLRPNADPPPAPGDAPAPRRPAGSRDGSAARSSDFQRPAADTPPAAEVRAAEAQAGPDFRVTRSPLPGETPPTPMADLLPRRELPPELVEGERAFAEGPSTRLGRPAPRRVYWPSLRRCRGLR
jgi:hypothetical protein